MAPSRSSPSRRFRAPESSGARLVHPPLDPSPAAPADCIETLLDNNRLLRAAFDTRIGDMRLWELIAATRREVLTVAAEYTSHYRDVDRPRDVADWIGRRLVTQGQSADRAALEFMVERVEGNLLAAHQEIRKLGLLYPEGRLSFEQVQDAVLNVARYDVFKLSEAMLSGDVARVARMLDGLKGEGEALPLVLWAVAEEIRTLLKLKLGTADGRPLAAMLKEYRIWGPRERLMAPALARVKLATLEDALAKAAQVDRMIKGLRAKDFAGDAWDALLQLALAVARK